LEACKFIRRVQQRVSNDRSKPNQYDFTGLIEAAKPYALEELQSREAARDERAQRSARKGKPKLKVVTMEGQK
jgi:hypothetical protein